MQTGQHNGIIRTKSLASCLRSIEWLRTDAPGRKDGLSFIKEKTLLWEAAALMERVVHQLELSGAALMLYAIHLCQIFYTVKSPSRNDHVVVAAAAILLACKRWDSQRSVQAVATAFYDAVQQRITQPGFSKELYALNRHLQRFSRQEALDALAVALRLAELAIMTAIGFESLHTASVGEAFEFFIHRYGVQRHPNWVHSQQSADVQSTSIAQECEMFLHQCAFSSAVMQFSAQAVALAALQAGFQRACVPFECHGRSKFQAHCEDMANAAVEQGLHLLPAEMLSGVQRAVQEDCNAYHAYIKRATLVMPAPPIELQSEAPFDEMMHLHDSQDANGMHIVPHETAPPLPQSAAPPILDHAADWLPPLPPASPPPQLPPGTHPDDASVPVEAALPPLPPPAPAGDILLMCRNAGPADHTGTDAVPEKRPQMRCCSLQDTGPNHRALARRHADAQLPENDHMPYKPLPQPGELCAIPTGMSSLRESANAISGERHRRKSCSPSVCERGLGVSWNQSAPSCSPQQSCRASSHGRSDTIGRSTARLSCNPTLKQLRAHPTQRRAARRVDMHRFDARWGDRWHEQPVLAIDQARLQQGEGQPERGRWSEQRQSDARHAGCVLDERERLCSGSDRRSRSPRLRGVPRIHRCAGWQQQARWNTVHRNGGKRDTLCMEPSRKASDCSLCQHATEASPQTMKARAQSLSDGEIEEGEITP